MKQIIRTLMRFFNALTLIICVFECNISAYATSDLNVDRELERIDQLFSINPQQARTALAELESVQNRFTPQQTLYIQVTKGSILGFFNQHHERVVFINGFIGSVQDPTFKSKFLYQLASSYVKLGEYELALNTLNTSIALLPRVTDPVANMDTLQSAITLFSSLHAYNDALNYANRMYDLPVPKQNLMAKCIASSNRVEIYMMLKQRTLARENMREAVEICDRIGWTFISQIVHALSAIDFIDNQEYLRGISVGLPALHAFPPSMINTDNAARLEDALARAYLHTGRLTEAEQYGRLAYQHASSQTLVKETEMSLETLVQIKRAQAQYSAALSYAEQALVQKNTLINELLQKNIAYQRVKFNIQDQSNQVTLLEKQNKILGIEKQLEKKNNQILWLIISLALIVATGLGLFLWKVTLQKNFFRRTTQIDGLTRINSRGHFLATAEDIVKKQKKFVSLILFDMDYFKRINDSFGHPVGDWVLVTVCKTVSAELHSNDLFGRLGGEEFAICLPDADATMAWQIAQRCRAAIEAIDTAACGEQFPLSASFGIAYLGAEDNRQFSTLLEAADKALYQAKSDGRNCVVVLKTTGVTEMALQQANSNEGENIAA